MTTATAVKTPPDKKFNEQMCFKFCYISLPSSAKHQSENDQIQGVVENMNV